AVYRYVRQRVIHRGPTVHGVVHGHLAAAIAGIRDPELVVVFLIYDDIRNEAAGSADYVGPGSAVIRSAAYKVAGKRVNGKEIRRRKCYAADLLAAEYG